MKVVKIRGDRFTKQHSQFQRYPRVGDIGTILEVYRDLFKVMCSWQATVFTIWLEAMFSDELQRV